MSGKKQPQQPAHHFLSTPLTTTTRVSVVVDGPMGAAELGRLREWVETILLPWADFRVVPEDGADAERTTAE